MRKSIVVSQTFNPKYDGDKPESNANSKYSYRVESAVNTVEVNIGQYLTPSQVEILIIKEINVTIQPTKGKSKQ